MCLKARGERDLFTGFGEDLGAALMVFGRADLIGAIKIGQGTEALLLARRPGLTPFGGLNLTKSINGASVDSIELRICGDRCGQRINCRLRGGCRWRGGSLFRLRALDQGLTSAVFEFLRVLDICGRSWRSSRNGCGGRGLRRRSLDHRTSCGL